MSIAVMTEVWKDAPVSGSELLMLLALADSANDDRECWPSVRHLEHKVRLSERQSRRMLKQLELDGLIEVVVNGGKGIEGRESNLYRILSMPPVADDTRTPVADDTRTPVADDTRTPVADDTLNHHLEPSLEPISPSGDALENPPQPKPKKEHKPNPVFDAVALGSFKLARVNGDKTAGAMIGKIVSWLNEQEGVTPERVCLFYEWYAQRNQNAAAPRDVAKFATWWMQFDAGNVETDPYAVMFANLTIIGDKS